MTAVLAQAQAITVPADATVENDWVTTFVMHSSSGEETVSEYMQVAFRGSDVYFNLPNPIAGNTWVKGTLGETTATFAKGQYLGDYSGAVYMVGQNTDGICDVEFVYNADSHVFMLNDMQIVLSSSATAIDAWAYYTGMTVVKGGQITGDTWTLTGRNVNPSNEEQYETLSEPVNVIISGSDISIQGLSAFDSSATIQGTISGTTATFPMNQSAGSYNGTALTFIGYAGESAVDIVFTYDETNGRLTAQSYILCVTSEGYTYQMLTDVVIIKGTSSPVEEEEELVAAPDGLTTEDYVFSGTSRIYNPDKSVNHDEKFALPVKVGFVGNEVYIQGFCYYLPEAWVKGSVANGKMTFAKNQYMGKMAGYPVYLMGKRSNELVDMVFTDKGNDEWSGGYFLLNASKTEEMPFDVYMGVTLKKGQIDQGIATMQCETDRQTFTDLQGRRVNESAHGLLITTKRASDGTLRSVKVVR